MIKNWKSTLIGAGLAAADVVLQLLQNADMTDWKMWLRPILFAALGYVVADARKSVQAIALMLACSFMLTSCAGLTARIQTPYGDVWTDAKGNVVIAPVAKPIVIPLSEK